MTANFGIDVDFGDFQKKLRKSIDDGLANLELKATIESEAAKAIESVITENQDTFRPDRGPDGGDDLIGFLGIGDNNQPDNDKIQKAWEFLLPRKRGDSRNFTSVFQQRKKRFGVIKYTIDVQKFYASPKANYISEGDQGDNLTIRWMENLIEGVPTAKVRDYPAEEEYVFLPSSRSGRSGRGRMVPVDSIRIPPRQFKFDGRGSSIVYDRLLDKITKRLEGSAFKGQMTKAIKKAFGG